MPLPLFSHVSFLPSALSDVKAVGEDAVSRPKNGITEGSGNISAILPNKLILFSLKTLAQNKKNPCTFCWRRA